MVTIVIIIIIMMAMMNHHKDQIEDTDHGEAIYLGIVMVACTCHFVFIMLMTIST